MPALTVSISADQLTHRLSDRLRGLNSEAPGQVLWQQHNGRVLLHVSSLSARFLAGWLLCNVDLQNDECGRQTLQFVFHLGGAGQGDGLDAAATIKTITPPAAQLAATWGPTVQQVLWDAVLDSLEVMVATVAAQHPGQAIALRGFQASPSGLTAVILAGEN